MRILMTGGAGLVGRAVVAHLASLDHEIISLVRTRSTTPVPKQVSERIADVTDAAVVDALMAEQIDAVVHLAAIPSPGDRTAVDLVAANTMATLAVLEAAAHHHVGTVVLASSLSVLGMAWSPEMMHPLAVPVTEDHPLRPAEGYGLSKELDEAAARMAARRWGLSVVSLRLPFTGTAEMIRERAALAENDDNTRLALAKELWGYLDVRDAARAVELVIAASGAGRLPGAHVLNVVADDVILDGDIAELLERWHPRTPVVGELGRGAYTTIAAAEKIGFRAVHLIGLSPSDDDGGSRP